MPVSQNLGGALVGGYQAASWADLNRKKLMEEQRQAMATQFKDNFERAIGLVKDSAVALDKIRTNAEGGEQSKQYQNAKAVYDRMIQTTIRSTLDLSQKFEAQGVLGQGATAQNAAMFQAAGNTAFTPADVEIGLKGKESQATEQGKTVGESLGKTSPEGQAAAQQDVDFATQQARRVAQAQANVAASTPPKSAMKTFANPNNNGEVVRGMLKNGIYYKEGTNEPVPNNWVDISDLANVEGAGGLLTGSQKGAEAAEVANARIATLNMRSGLSQLQDFVRSNNYVGGFTGDMINLLNSAFQQVAQVTGMEELFVNGQVNINFLDDDLKAENLSFLRKAAISGNVRESTKARLAYALAKQLDPNGRISNADIDNAERILSGTADRQATIISLENLKQTATKEFNNMAKVKGDLVSGQTSPFAPLSPEDGSTEDPSKLSDEELLMELNRP